MVYNILHQQLDAGTHLRLFVRAVLTAAKYLLGISKNLPFSLLWRGFKGGATKKSRFLEEPY